MSEQAPKSPLKILAEEQPMHASTAAVLTVVAEQLSAGDPLAVKSRETDPRQKSSGPNRLTTRLQTGIRARVSVDKNRTWCSGCAVAAKSVNRVDSWLHVCRLACETSTDGHGLHDPYGTLRSDEEWSTCTNSVR